MKQLSHMQAVMGENIEKVLQREEKVEIVVKKTKNIDYIADEIKKNTNDMKKQAFLAKHRCKILIGACVVAAAGGLFFII